MDAPSNPPPLDPFTGETPQRNDRATFSDRVDFFVTWLIALITQFTPFTAWVKTTAQQVYNNAVSAYNYSVAAFNSATAADASKTAAAGSASSASADALTASNAATAAANSATQSATVLKGTSTTSLTVGLGAKALITQAGKAFDGANVQLVSAADTTKQMFGLASYSGTSLSLNVVSILGSGTAADWKISVVGASGKDGTKGDKGDTGDITTGGTMAGALNLLKSASSIPSAATINPWGITGNSADVTGTVTTTGLTAAPNAGATRTLKSVAAWPLTCSANFLIAGVPVGRTYTTSPGDLIYIYADTTTAFKVFIQRADGAPMSVPISYGNTDLLLTTGVFTARVSGWHQAILIGAAGSGAVAVALGGGARACATGGATSGKCIKVFWANAGDTYTFVAGLRGASVGVTSITATQAVQGNDGGVSTFIGPGVSLTCTGGGKGNSTVATGNPVIANGATPGTATGGDYNFAGSPSGYARVDCPGTGGLASSSGGAAVPWKGVPNPSGNANSIRNTGGLIAVSASGGAGIGGKSGNADANNSNRATSSGAGAAGPSLNSNDIPTDIGPAPLAVIVQSILNMIGAGSAGSVGISGSPTGEGAGTGGQVRHDGDGSASGANSGSPTNFNGGTGGIALQGVGEGSTISWVGGSANYGGASGAVTYCISSSTLTTISAKSGDSGRAYVVIQSP